MIIVMEKEQINVKQDRMYVRVTIKELITLYFKSKIAMSN